MLGAQDRRPVPREFVEECPDLGRARRIELGGRLVEDEHLRAHRDDARDRDALLLAAGQGERLPIGQVADPEAVQ